jgi:DNA invertase Pin-like site-specific DNA recombinase
MANAKKTSLPATLQYRGHAPVLEAVPQRFLGYARVSRDDQVLDMQVTALRNAGVQEQDLYVEKISAVNAHRPQFHLLMKMIEPGDTLMVYAFSRLCRDLKQLLTIVDEMNKFGVTMRSTSEPHINPFTTNGRLLLSVVGAVDENELGRIRDRTRDGMAERKRQGMFFGRKRLVTPIVAAEMRKMRYERNIAVPRIADHFKVKPSTVYANTKR